MTGRVRNDSNFSLKRYAWMQNTLTLWASERDSILHPAMRPRRLPISTPHLPSRRTPHVCWRQSARVRLDLKQFGTAQKHIERAIEYSDSYAKILHRGRPYSVLVYSMGPQRPAYHSILRSQDILHTESCWVRIDTGTGHLLVEQQYSNTTSYAFVFVTASVRVE